MEPLLARYLDGELTEAEAAALIERAESDPAIALALSVYEVMLTAARELPATAVPAGFADRILERVARAPAPETAQRTPASPPGARIWPTGRAGSSAGVPVGAWLRGLAGRGHTWVPTAMAAGLALVVFAAGIVAGRLALTPGGPAGEAPAVETGPPSAPSAAATRTLMAGTPWIAAAAGDDQRLVRLVYVPRRADVQRVTVAGSFNSWDPESLEMYRAGDIFVAMISLPPGAYEYMFVEDGQHWVTDPLAMQTRGDGFGNENAVLDLTL